MVSKLDRRRAHVSALPRCAPRRPSLRGTTRTRSPPTSWRRTLRVRRCGTALTGNNADVVRAAPPTASWEAARNIYVLGGRQTDAQQPDRRAARRARAVLLGTRHRRRADPALRIIRSTDRGATWSAPSRSRDPDGRHRRSRHRQGIRDGSGIGSIAVAPNGTLAVADVGRRFAHDGGPSRARLEVRRGRICPRAHQRRPSGAAFMPKGRSAPTERSASPYYDPGENTPDPVARLLARDPRRRRHVERARRADLRLREGVSWSADATSRRLRRYDERGNSFLSFGRTTATNDAEQSLRRSRRRDAGAVPAEAPR